MLFHLIIELMLEIHGCINGKKQKCKFEMKFEFKNTKLWNAVNLDTLS